ncbi:MAG: hypothetical protein R2710_16985 [Acidimicrobiales bacterium]
MTTVSSPTTLPALIERGGLWPVRIVWFVLPLLIGPGLLDTVDGRSGPVQTVVEVGAWAAWFVGLVSVMAPSTVTLTLLRTVAPATVVAPLVGALTAGSWPVGVVIALLGGLVANAIVFLPTTGEPMINGSAYGAEKRMALRPPASILIGPLYLAWGAVFVGVAAGPLLLAAKNWWLGVPLTIVGIFLAITGVRSLHQLSRRWIVFVPVGFVIHDYWSLAESLLVQRKNQTHARPSRRPSERRPTPIPAPPTARSTSPAGALRSGPVAPAPRADANHVAGQGRGHLDHGDRVLVLPDPPRTGPRRSPYEGDHHRLKSEEVGSGGDTWMMWHQHLPFRCTQAMSPPAVATIRTERFRAIYDGLFDDLTSYCRRRVPPDDVADRCRP